MFDDDFLFGDDVETAADTAADDTAEQRRTAEAQEARLRADADAYAEMLPEIAAARPLPPQSEEAQTETLSGTAWLLERLRAVILPLAPPGARVVSGRTESAVFATVQLPAGSSQEDVSTSMLDAIQTAGNLGEFRYVEAGDGAFTIRRDSVGGSVSAWASHGTRGRLFFETEAGRDKVFDLAGLYQRRKKDSKVRRYPGVIAFGEDHRGGTATLRLRPGMTLAQVKAAEGKLRQLFRAPDLVVDSAPGSVDPIIHLNTKPVARELPATNPLAPERLVRVRTQAERFAAAGDFVLPIGVYMDEETGDARPILVNQDKVPHLAVFGGTGSGKTYFLSMLVRAAVLQGAEVVIWDAKSGGDMHDLASDRTIPGVIHYAAGSQAVLHRTILWVRHEFERRQALAQLLRRRGVKYRPAPLLFISDEFPAWIKDGKAARGDRKEAAMQTEAHLNFIASQARELRVFFCTGGQDAYVEGYAGDIRTNTSTLLVLGQMEKVNADNLFKGSSRERAVALAETISKAQKGVGVVVINPEDAPPTTVKFKGFFNAPGTPEAQRFAAVVEQAPRLRRFAYELPRGDAEGGDGTWADWTPATDPSSDSLPVRILDGPDGRPIPEAAVDDPTHADYSPGRRPQPQVHANPN